MGAVVGEWIGVQGWCWCLPECCAGRHELPIGGGWGGG